MLGGVCSAGRRFASSSVGHPNSRTCLYQLHLAMGAKMVPFAGFDMPLTYSGQSVSASVKHTRSAASVFDVSHMLQTSIRGKDWFDWIHRMMERISPINLRALKDGQGALTVFTNEQGGILDDLIVNRVTDSELYVVTNAACAEQDALIMQSTASACRAEGLDVHAEQIQQRALIALQGPSAVSVLQAGVSDVDLSSLYFMHGVRTRLFGIDDCTLTRCGYTGEDGFEISVPETQANNLCEQLLQSHVTRVQMAGLAARDVLRLEAGLCLYGQDIDQATTLVEADLKWLLGKRRREAADFPGASVVLDKLANPSAVQRVRVGLTGAKGRPAREKTPLLTADGTEIGVVTSGCPSPSLGYNVAMGYVPPQYAKPGTQLQAKVGNNAAVQVEVAKMPFLPTNYFVQPRKPKQG